jgi:hypothetical protein
MDKVHKPSDTERSEREFRKHLNRRAHELRNWEREQVNRHYVKLVILKTAIKVKQHIGCIPVISFKRRLVHIQFRLMKKTGVAKADWP